jgi:tetraacyldisaccharide 4'-kinase
MCVYLARLIHDAGYRVTIISRGYGGGAEKKGAVAECGISAFADAQRFGDEPALMTRLLASRPIAVIVGRDRIASGQLALKRFQPEVILLDDGFQHQRLARDLNIVLMDAQKPLGNGHLLPRGPLREPPSALGRADILVMTRYPTEATGFVNGHTGQQNLFDNTRLAAKPLFACQHAPVVRSRLVKSMPGGLQTRSLELAMLKGMPVIAFAGIARSEAFRQTVVELGADLRGWRSFDDHHPFYRDDI